MADEKAKNSSLPSSAATSLAHSGRGHDHAGAVNMPVYHVSTILYKTLAALRGKRPPTSYGRKGTPTSRALLESVAALERTGEDGGAVVLPSGLAAVTITLLACVKSGSHILVTDGVYAPTRIFCDTMLKDMGVETEYYDPANSEHPAALMRPETSLIVAESPSSQTFEVQDLPKLAAIAHEGGALLLADNTWATPLFCRPLELGADISIQAATKYLAGHSDLLLGVASARAPLYKKLLKQCQRLGVWTGPDDMALTLRGMRTLDVRLARHQENALALARFLAGRAEVRQVIHPALSSHPQHTLWQRDFSGASGLFAVELQTGFSENNLSAMLDNMRWFAMGYSWGGYESLIVPVEPVRQFPYLGQGSGQILRVHAGLENIDDLLADMEAGLARLAAK